MSFHKYVAGATDTVDDHHENVADARQAAFLHCKNTALLMTRSDEEKSSEPLGICCWSLVPYESDEYCGEHPARRKVSSLTSLQGQRAATSECQECYLCHLPLIFCIIAAPNSAFLGQFAQCRAKAA